MRGNSGFLRWIIIGCCLLIINSFALVNTGPVHHRPRRMIREAYPDTEPIRHNDTTQTPTCLMDGVQVSINIVTCEKKPGCRAIQKTGECCPEYQCECERNGKTYANGEKLVDPETPCRVCYCQGGEFTCNNVTCYVRSDCEPKYYPGRCCPEYDNCPPLEHVKLGQSDDTKSVPVKKDQTAAFSSTTQQFAETTPSINEISTNPARTDQILTPMKDNPLGIKIKEITKPEEIRITDEKPKFNPKIKISDVSNQSKTPMPVIKTTKVFIDDTNRERDEALNDFDTSSISPENIFVLPEEVNHLENINIEADGDQMESNKNVRHTAEHVMVIKKTDKEEKSNSNEDKVASSTENPGDRQNYSDEISPGPETLGYPDLSSTTTESSLELVNDEDVSTKKPAILNVGDKVVFVDHNGQSKPITIHGVEGLVRGEDPEIDNSPDQDRPSSTTEFFSTSSDSYSSPKYSENLEKSDTVLSQNPAEKLPTKLDLINDEQESTVSPHEQKSLDNVASSSHVIVVTSIPFGSVENNDNNLELFNNAFTYGGSRENLTDDSSSTDEIFDTILYTSGSNFSSELNNSQSDEIFETIFYDSSGITEEYLSSSSENYGNSTETYSTSTSEAPHLHHDETSPPKTYIEEDEIPNHELINPEYPSIPEDVSFYGREHDQVANDGHHIGEEEVEHSSRMPSIGVRADLDSELENLRNETSSSIVAPKQNLNLAETTASPTISPENWSSTTNYRPSTENDEFNASTLSPLLLWQKTDTAEANRNLAQIIAISDVQERSPGEPLLIPEWELNETSSTEPSTSSQNYSFNLDDVLQTFMHDINRNTDDNDTDPGSGGSEMPIGDYQQYRKGSEPTTTRSPLSGIELIAESSSEEGNNSRSENLEYSPKDEVENLKYQNEDTSSSFSAPDGVKYFISTNDDMVLDTIKNFFNYQINRVRN